EAIRDEKVKVLQALRPITGGEVERFTVRGQYTGAGDMPGYLDEPASTPPTDASRRVETFTALRAEVRNWRWAGVPFYLRTGKRLASRNAEIVVEFRPTPLALFPGANRPNKLVIKLQPEDGLELHLSAARGTAAGEELAPVFLDLACAKAFGRARVGAYERLLLDAIAGRTSLFVRSDEQEEAWRWVEPVLDDWTRDAASSRGPDPYVAGSMGP